MTHRLAGMGQKKKYGGLTVLNPKGDRHFNGVVRCHEDALNIPLKVKKPTTWFVNSMSDLFHKDVPFEFIDKVFAVMALCPQHTFQQLTKRPERAAEYHASNPLDRVVCLSRRISRTSDRHDEASNVGDLLSSDLETYLTWPLPNVWLGTSCEDQETANERIPHLLKCPAAVRFLSCEPLLGAIDLTHIISGPDDGSGWIYRHWNALTNENWCDCTDLIDNAGTNSVNWIIAGGESGRKARPCNVEWIRSIIQQCKAAGVACFVKQLGAKPLIADIGRIQTFLVPTDPKGGDPAEWTADLRVREMPVNAGVRV
jgi:protein gp37